MYDCKVCNYKTEIKSNYNKHLQTKKHKQNIMNTSNNILINENDTKIKYVCENCNKTYKYKKGFITHKNKCIINNDKKSINNDKNHTDINTKIDTLLHQMYYLIEENNKLNKEIKIIKEKKEIINNNTTNYIQNNIKLLSYKNTDISHLTDKHFIKCLSKINMCIPSLIILLHFNSNKPENYNTYISNIKNKYILFYDGTKWNYKNRDDGLNELFYKGQNILECKIDEWEETGKEYPTAMNNYKRFLKNIDNDSVVEEIKKAIELILYNHRDIVKNSK